MALIWYKRRQSVEITSWILRSFSIVRRAGNTSNMASDNRATRSPSTAPSKSSFSIDNILNIQNTEPQEARKMETFPQGFSNVPPVATVPTLMPTALRPSLMDFNITQMLAPLPLQSPLNFEDFHMAAAHPFPTFPFSLSYPRQGITMRKYS